MSSLSGRDLSHVFEQLRKGLVPERGLEAFAVGIERARGELRRQLEHVAGGEGSIKFLRGGYGCGKTFMARLAVLEARSQGFATSFVVVSDNDLRFHRFDDVYRKVVAELGTASCPRGALGDVLDRWIAKVEATLVAGGEDEDAPDFDEKVARRLDDDLAAMTGQQAPADFVRVVRTIFELKQRGALAEAGALISWLSGSGNVAAAAKQAAGIRGDIGSRDALDYLRGVLEIVKAAGYQGLLVVIDEAETILRMRSDSRHKSLNGLRQIADAAGGYPGLLWLVTGTPEFFDTPRGVAGLAPLHDRIRFIDQHGFVSLRQPQLALEPFDRDRLRRVAVQLRELFPTADRARLEARVDDVFLARLVDEVTAGFRGDVGVVPRQFLRELVTVFDSVDESEGAWVPMEAWGFRAEALAPEEQHALSGAGTAVGPPDDEDAAGPVPVEDVW